MYVLFTFLVAMTAGFLVSAQEYSFYVQDGALVVLDGQAGVLGRYDSVQPTLFVDGDFWNMTDGVTDEGFFNAMGELHITGDFYQPHGGGFESGGDEVFCGVTQRLSGVFDTGRSSFFNLYVAPRNDLGYLESATDVLVEHQLNILRGRVRTDTIGHGLDGAAYSAAFMIWSTDSGAMDVADDSYIEGVLARRVVNGVDYVFPVGGEPGTTHTTTGKEPCTLNNVRGVASVPAWVRVGLTGDPTFSLDGLVVYYDVGTYVGRFFGVHDMLASGADVDRDGILDLLILDEQDTEGWFVVTDGQPITYDFEVFPSVAFLNQNQPFLVPSTGEPLSFFAHNGLINNQYPDQAPAPWGAGAWPEGLPGVIATPASSPFLIENVTTPSEFRFGQVGTGDLISILPIELSDFSGSCDGSTKRITWQTESEVNHDRFILESSSDAVHWTAVQEVLGTGSPNLPATYEVSTNTVDAYFRLVSVALDGARELSDIIRVECTNEVTGIEVHPTVTSGPVTITANFHADMRYMVLDISGRIIKQGTIDQPRTDIDITDDCVPGQYLISVFDRNQSTTKQIVKQ